MRKASLIFFILVSVLLGSHGESGAEDRPSNRNLVLAGVAMALPTYMLGVVVHEGSHALTARLLGARITDFSLIPGLHPRSGKFYFGYVSVRGLRSDKDRGLFLVAPKLSDAALLSAFAALYVTDSLPHHGYGKTALLVLATGFWVDFSKDIFSFWNHNDTVKIYNLLGLSTEWKRLPARLVHLGISLGFGYSIVRAYDNLFNPSEEGVGVSSLLLPLWNTSF